MFADINQVIDAFGKYFIIDTYGSRTVVSFDHNGKPLASYGKHGNAPNDILYQQENYNKIYHYCFSEKHR